MKIKCCFGLFFLVAMPFVYGQKIKGLSFVGTKAVVQPKQFLPVVQLGATWVTLMPFGYMRSAGDTLVQFDTSWQWEGETTVGLKKTIPLFKNKGIKIMLKPQIWISKGVYTGKINPQTPGEWAALKMAYKSFVLHFAKVAAEYELPLYCIGTELSSLVKEDEQFWRNLIQAVRKNYKGQLVYAENWDQYQAVPFWDALDYIGINAYFPLKGDLPTTIASIQKRWANASTQMAQLSERENKAVLFTEMGYRSIADPLSRPWDYSVQQQPFDSEMQAMALAALLAEFMPKPWWKGGFIWQWFPDHTNAGGMHHTGFSPQNKPAEAVLRNYFTKRE